MNFFKRLHVVYLLRRYAIKRDLWEKVFNQLGFLEKMSSVEKAHFRELTTLFLYEKNIYGAQEFELNEEMRVIIAAQACIPIMQLGIDLLGGWTDIIVYPAAFQVSREQYDEFGVVHQEDNILSGEAWQRGPVIFSWQDIQQDMQQWQKGHNVIVHEIAHKLDMRNGVANGMPPLHVGMQSAEWASALGDAYKKINQRLERHQPIAINPYAATSPAEFFAVISEYFFCAPQILEERCSDVYQLLCTYYQQDPLQRMSK
ncbi:MAG: hypothetical protein GQ582_13025 [Methyloprofundus sp.]|nr:hypothetical protein [Methyloprofundus sp.]